MKKTSGIILLICFTVIFSHIVYSQTLPKPNKTFAELDFICSVQNGFKLDKSGQYITGFIDYMKIGDTVLKNDFSVIDPENFDLNKKVVGVLSRVSWKSGYADPLYFEAQVGVDNKNSIASLQHTSMLNSTVEFGFSVYSYDVKEKKYFKAFTHTATTLTGTIYKSGGQLAWQIYMDYSMEVMSPRNHTFFISIAPAEKTQAIDVASSSTDKISKMWKSSTFGTSVKGSQIIPHEIILKQNYPNPFNPNTTIEFTMPKNTWAKMNIYNSLGQLISTIFDKELSAGEHEIAFDGSNYVSGVYFYQLIADDYQSVKKFTILK